MSKLIDERIVEMSFDNSNFEKNVKKSMSSIDKLKASLDFSAVEVAAISAISNITNKLVDMGIAFTKSLTTDNIVAGWSKYESKAKSVGTLLAQGEYTLEQINEQLAYLSWYSDETSYSFTEMFNNLTKFTAAGIGLEDATSAMIGIANWAAAAGQNSTTAAGAMYQLSQAMANGYIRYQDWREAAVNKNMATTEIEEIIALAAAEQGALTRIVKETGEIVYELIDGTQYELSQLFSSAALTDKLWLTRDIFLQAMKDIEGGTDEVYEKWAETGEKVSDILTDIEDQASVKFFKAASEARSFSDAVNAIKDAAQTAYATIFEDIFGEYSTSVKLWTALANKMYETFVDPLWKIEETVSEWNQMGGMSSLFQLEDENNAAGALWNLYTAITKITGTFKEAKNEIFGGSGASLYEMTSKFQEFTKLLIISDEIAGHLTIIFKSLFNIIKQTFKITKQLISYTKPVIDVAINATKTLLSGISQLTSAISYLFDSFNQNGINVTEGLSDGINKGAAKVKNTMITLASNVLGWFNRKLKINSPSKEMIKSGEYTVEGFIKGITNKTKNVWYAITGWANTLKEKVKQTATEIKDSIIAEYKETIAILNNNWFTGPLIKILENVYSIAKTILSTFSAIYSEIKNAIKGVDELAFPKVNLTKNTSRVQDEMLSVYLDLPEKLEEYTKKTKAIDKIEGTLIESAADNYERKFKTISKVIDKIEGNLVENSLEDYEKIFEDKENVLDVAAKKLAGYLRIVSDVLNRDGDTLLDNFLKLFSNIFSKIADMLEVFSSLKVYGTLQNIFKDITDLINSFLVNINTLLQSGEGLIGAVIKSLPKTLRDFNSQTAKEIKNDSTTSEVCESIEENVDEITSTVESASDNLFELSANIMDSLISAFQTIKTSLYKAIITVMDKLTPVINTLANTIGVILIRIADTIVEILDIINESLTKLADMSEKSPLTKLLDNVVSFASVLVNVISLIIPIVNLLITSLTTLINEAAVGEDSPLYQFIASVARLMMEIARTFVALLPIVAKVLDCITAILDKFNNNKNVTSDSTTGVLTTAFENLIIIIQIMLTALADIIKLTNKFLTNIKEGQLVSDNMSRIVNIIIKIVLAIAALIAVRELFYSLTPLKSVKTLFRSISFVTDSISSYLDTLKLAALASSIASIVKSLAQLVVVIGVLASYKKETFKTGFARLAEILGIIALYMTVILGGLIAVTSVIVKLAATTNICSDAMKFASGFIIKASVSILILMGAIGILVLALKQLSLTVSVYSEYLEEAKTILVTLTAVVLLFSIALLAFTKYFAKMSVTVLGASEILKSCATFFVQLGLAIVELSAAIAILVGALILLTRAIQKCSKENLIWSIAIIAGLIIVILLFVKHIETVSSNLTATSAARIKYVSGAFKLIGASLVDLSKSIVIAAFAIIMMALAFKYLPDKEMWKALGLFTVLVVLITTISVLSQKAAKSLDAESIQKLSDSFPKISKALLVMSESILILTVAIAVLAVLTKFVKKEDISDSSWIIIVLFAAVGTMIIVLNRLMKGVDVKDFEKNINMMYAIGVLVLILAAAVSGLAFAIKYAGGEGKFIGATAIVVVLMGALTLMVVAIQKMLATTGGDTKVITKAAILIGSISLMMLLLSGIVVALVFLMKEVGKEDVKVAAFIAASCILAIAVLIKSMTKMTNEMLPGAFKKFISMSAMVTTMLLIVGGFLTALAFISTIGFNTTEMLTLGKMMMILTGVLYALVGLVALMNKIDAPASSTLAVAAIVLEISALVGALYLLSSIETDKLQSSMKSLTKIMLMVAGLTAGVVALSAITSNIPAISSSLTAFGVAAMKVVTPVALLTLAIAGLVAAIGYLKSVKNAEIAVDTENTESIEENNDVLRTSTRLRKRAASAVENLTESTSDNTETNQNGVFSKVYTVVGGMIGGFSAAIVNNKEAIVNATKAVFEVVISALGDLVYEIIHFLKTSILTLLINTFVDTIITVIKAATSRLPEIMGAVRDFFKAIFDFLGADSGNGNSNMKEFARSFFTVVWQFVLGVLETIKEHIYDISVLLTEIVAKVIEASIDTLPLVVDKLIDVAVVLFYLLGKAFYNASGQLGQAIAYFTIQATAGIIKMIGVAIPTIKDAIRSALIEMVGDLLSEVFGNRLGNKFKDKLLSWSKDASSTTTDAFTTIADKLASSIEDDGGLTITPVIDLEEIQNGAASIKSILGSVGTGISASWNEAKAASKEIKATKNATSSAASSDDIASLNETLANQNGETYNNTFNITGSNAKEIANEVNNILQKQVNKGRVAYGN